METKPNIKILVCCHKPCDVPNDDAFMPIQVGKAISDIDLGFQGDDTGDNISKKNKSYCELTAMYWAWKNLKGVDYIGLCHYRRYFDFIKTRDLFFFKRTVNYIPNIHSLKKYDIILKSPIGMNISSGKYYKLCHIPEDYYILCKVILDMYPNYIDTLNYFEYNNNKWTAYNMFFCKYELFDKYCKWLFSILFELEKHIKSSPYSYQKRVFGFMGEFLLPLFCHHNKLKIKYLPIQFTENKNYIRNFKVYAIPIYNFIENVSFKINNLVIPAKNKNINISIQDFKPYFNEDKIF